ncbi:MAG TPA: DNA polymerase I [Gammaproteobacteria bacterium]|nr:DNA polymerase I [Xanthomonadales bacterium]MCB1593356.1 DNA polymerase I [Xanthomonadales bacterium]HOP22627.1 DNA polymerase I [Gammaproteobacteria bacterium]HPI94605.1 DNA polymerase I [Gammaproteobacteria bacterium]HPQ86050.1 DNA polymerase I [Gammaproteobacteria bacterium]
MSEKTLYLVDGSAYLYRAHFVPALQRLKNHKGEPTGMIYGVINMINRMIKEYDPKYMAVVFDAPGKTFRHDMYDQYKATRPPMPDDLRNQIQPTKDIIKALGVPLLEIKGVEADDVMGTLGVMASQAGFKTVISSGDKDMAQLVNDDVMLIDTMRKTSMNIDGVKEKFGVRPDQIIDYLTLIGDTSDNIPGVNKVGPKTAVKWLEEHETLDNIIENANQVKGKVGEYLREAIPQIPLSKQLVTIDTSVPLDCKVQDLTINGEDVEQLNILAQEFGIRSLQRETQTDLFSQVSTEPETDTETQSEKNYTTIRDEKTLEQWLEKIRNEKIIAFDLETTSLDSMQAEIVGMSFSCKPGEAAYTPIAHVEKTEEQLKILDNQLELQSVLNQVEPLLNNPEIKLIGQHFKYDMNVLSNYGIEINNLSDDSLMESYVLDTNGRHDMDTLAMQYLQKQTIKYEDICGKGAKQISFAEVPVDVATQYAAEDSDITLQLHLELSKKLQEHQQQQQLKVYREIEMPLIQVLAKMEQTGVLVDSKTLEKQSEELSIKIAQLEQQAYELVGREFNLNSPKQLQEILFEEQNIPVIKKTPTGQPSTSEDVLQELAEDYELPRIIIDNRSFSKLKSTYTDKLPQEINSRTGRIHTSYHQAVATTGRLSSTNPNLQNIPIRTEEGRKIRQAFVAPEGFKIMAADYSQIELRIMAHLSKDEKLLDSFAKDQDVHSRTASQVFGVEIEEVSKDQRRAAKAINFGLMYGMSAFGLAKQLGVERGEAQDYMNRYFDQYPKVAEFMKTIKEQAKENAYVDTLFGRRLYFPEIKNRNGRIRAGAERAAINAPMQGTAADIIKQAMLKVFAEIKNNPDIRMIMQVHDELVFEVREEKQDELAVLVKNLMEKAVQLSIPLKVDIGIGDNWDEAH